MARSAIFQANTNCVVFELTKKTEIDKETYTQKEAYF